MNATLTLTPDELELAAMVGVKRHIGALRDRRADQHGATRDNGWTLHIEGAAGEMATARALGRYWGAPIGTYKRGGDVGAVQVRTRCSDDYDLLIRDRDRADDVFVLVTGLAPNFTVRGWIYGHEARRDEWRKEHGGRPAAWFVPQSALHPLRTLPGVDA